MTAPATNASAAVRSPRFDLRMLLLPDARDSACASIRFSCDHTTGLETDSRRGKETPAPIRASVLPSQPVQKSLNVVVRGRAGKQNAYKGQFGIRICRQLRTSQRGW